MRATLALSLASFTLVVAAAGCGGSVVFSEGGGGSGGDEPPVASGPAPDGPGPVGPGGPVGAGGNGAVTTVAVSVVGPGPGGGAEPQRCSLTELFADPTCDACALDACCAEAEACITQLELCATRDGQVDPSSPLGGPLLACLGASCAGECGVEPVELCDSGLLLWTDDPATDAALTACFNQSCCDAFAPCTADGDLQACVECLNGVGDPDRCAAADACALEACGVGLAVIDVCGSGYLVRGLDAGNCMADGCCPEAVACTSDGADPGSCTACIAEGGGPLCNDLLACQEELCGIPVEPPGG